MGSEDAALQALGRRLVGLLESIDEKLDRLGMVNTDLLVLAMEVLQASGKEISDEALPILEDGTCPSCDGVKVAVPPGKERNLVRICSSCSFRWRVTPIETDVQEVAGE